MSKSIKNIILLGVARLVIIALIIGFIFIPKKDYEEKIEFFESESSDLIFSYIDRSVSLGDVAPTLDKFGVLNEPFSFSIKNTSSIDKDCILKLVDSNSTIKNEFIRYQLSKNGAVVGVFSLQDDGVIDEVIIKSNEEVNYSVRLWLDFKSEAKAGSVNLKISLSEKELDNTKINKPVLTDGMIPVYYDENKMSFVKTSTDNLYNYEWYDYLKGKWANAVTVDSAKREEYENKAIGSVINMKDINSMWVWIPRFTYTYNNEKISISFVDENEEAYEAFNFNKNNLKGFWITKFEAGMSEDSSCHSKLLTSECNHQNQIIYFKPNMPLLNRITMSNLFYSFRKMELKDNIYGFSGTGDYVNADGTINNDDNNFDIHMIRNSEWQAVALLSMSIYGQNEEMVYPNDSNYSGKAFFEHQEYNYDVKNIGTLASTTGNIYGVYDMNGARREYVMISTSENNIFLDISNSGFNNIVEDYYYDKGLSASDKMVLVSLNLDEYLINNEPLTRGGYKSAGSNIFSIYGVKDYIDKISSETNSRAVLSILDGGNNGEKEKES